MVFIVGQAVDMTNTREEFSAVDAKSLANFLLDMAQVLNILVSNMKLQKLVYFCHADFLVQTGRPLITQNFEAWDHGPVIPCLYQEFKVFGADPILGRAYKFDPIGCTRVIANDCNLGVFEDLVIRSFEVYSRYSASALSSLSHKQNGPWSAALVRFENGTHRGKCIENELIALHHFHPNERSVH